MDGFLLGTIFRENKKSRFSLKIRILRCFAFFLWCHQESNRGHKDFQSFALPTELWHHHFLFAVAKVGPFSETTKCFQRKSVENLFIVHSQHFIGELFFFQRIPTLRFQLEFLSVAGDETASKLCFRNVTDDFDTLHGRYFVVLC